jgi:predicted dehydrogenase
MLLIYMRAAIIGCSLIGRKRYQALAGCRLSVCCDTFSDRAEALAKTADGVVALADWQAAVTRPDVDIVVVATTHDMLAPIGFNHRYHRAFRKSREIFESGALGDIMFVRGRYGHGGRPGYDKEWRTVPEHSGGGELVDRGMHLIDLARWFLGDFEKVCEHIATYFWNMPVEDNGFLLLRTHLGQTAFLHASWTEWKNTFSFEIYGRTGKLEIAGLGGSYGVERVTLYRMSPELGTPETTIWEYPMADDFWEVEFREFLDDIRLGRSPSPGLAGAQAALGIVERIYQESGR